MTFITRLTPKQSFLGLGDDFIFFFWYLKGSVGALITYEIVETKIHVNVKDGTHDSEFRLLKLKKESC